VGVETGVSVGGKVELREARDVEVTVVRGTVGVEDWQLDCMGVALEVSVGAALVGVVSPGVEVPLWSMGDSLGVCVGEGEGAATEGVWVMVGRGEAVGVGVPKKGEEEEVEDREVERSAEGVAEDCPLGEDTGVVERVAVKQGEEEVERVGSTEPVSPGEAVCRGDGELGDTLGGALGVSVEAGEDVKVARVGVELCVVVTVEVVVGETVPVPPPPAPGEAVGEGVSVRE